LGPEPERALELFAEDVVCDVSERPGGRIWHGPLGVRDAMVEWRGAWEEWELETERYVDAGADRVLILWRERGRGKGSGVPIEQRGGNLLTIREGRIVHIRLYMDQQAALVAAGVA
jgi:ketosteroid isomerase-like protein